MQIDVNQNPEQIARDSIDKLLRNAGWAIQSAKKINWNESLGIAIKEYQTDVGPADYVLFVDRKPVGIVEAKKEDVGQNLSTVEEQSSGYANAKLKYLNNDPLRFIYESTGALTRFTDYQDPKPRAREVFSFHTPQTLLSWSKQEKTLRERFFDIPELETDGFRPAQIKAIRNLESSFKQNKPRALIQMATGAGKTFTAASFIYRLLKFANAKRILFLVDTKNLGEQAEQEFMKFVPQDDNRKFTELYNVQRLSSSYIASDAQVCISTIQRLYSILKGEELDDKAEEENPNESSWKPKEPLPVVYNEKYGIETFDFIIIDECHRSIYNLWQQVLDYFDSYLVGLTATPDKRTFGFFNENVVSEYTYEESVADGVNVPYDVFVIETDITKNGAKIEAKELIEKREKLSRRKRWERTEEEEIYTANKLDKDVVNPSQIRNIIKAYKENLPKIFPNRIDENGEMEVPKTLIFAKTDSHADDIIKIVREEFGEGNDFCKKVTYKIDEDPKSVINRFRNNYNPRIAVTVDMIATGTDIKPLEVLLFMRDVKSTNYFQQMIGRGSRTINDDDLQQVSRMAKVKTHFVVVDAIGATKSKKTDSRPLERKPSVPMKDLLGAVLMGATDEDLFTSLANRLIRLDKQITEDEKEKITELSGGKTINHIIKDLLNVYDPDVLETVPQEELIKEVQTTFNGELNDYLENVRRVHEQIIDVVNLDTVLVADWDKDSTNKANEIITEFQAYIQEHKDEITALKIFYNEPHRRRELTSKMVKELLSHIKANKPRLAPSIVWEAYRQLEEINPQSPKSEIIALVSILRRLTGLDSKLTGYDLTIDKNFQKWVFAKQAGSLKYSSEQMEWLRMIKEHIATSLHVDTDDFELAPFNAKGGLGKMWQLFGEEMNNIIDELNEALAA
ncbi:type I restriction endonuclease subunit R [Aliarcobacter cryaerophilus]|uniref:type I restriction endonuclease subunit R n=1 Tax=Aliarcobacter cryaerophilus TaxID=28198 RepID=UPI0021B52892|nr:DEAD/DEAH box helicase family protein [Aliarcobacter cryaerophilus]MCT7406604.1 DEAD/DEAH box helicase family protein [Aliarcobacter cryaerophilus]MCT7504316.1 DEAD/DEAH box helicase family protein [Aliarcobacter cryaerophilus]